MADHVEETQEPVCTCDPKLFPFVTEQCPVHPKEVKPYVSQPFIVTDANLLEPQMVPFLGFLFRCPACTTPGLIVNQYAGNFCPKCGVQVIVQSKTVTEYLRGL